MTASSVRVWVFATEHRQVCPEVPQAHQQPGAHSTDLRISSYRSNSRLSTEIPTWLRNALNFYLPTPYPALCSLSAKEKCNSQHHANARRNLQPSAQYGRSQTSINKRFEISYQLFPNSINGEKWNFTYRRVGGTKYNSLGGSFWVMFNT